MRRTISTVLAGIIVASASIVPVAPAFSQMRDGKRFDRNQSERFVGSYCRQNSRDPDCRVNRRGWDERRYQSWYRNRYRDRNDNNAAAFFGLAAGLVAGAAISSANQTRGVVVVDNGHTQRCAARYVSYDWNTDTFMGYDGYRHPCRL